MPRNASDAFQTVLRSIQSNGDFVENKGIRQKEILSNLIKIERPDERFIVIPRRNNNVFAQIAESLWVLAGRNDLNFISNYLPRAKEFSDDGETWRAGYGPRLRSWRGQVDQVKEIENAICEAPNNKRSVVSLYDPLSDFQKSKDIPCNNWLQFIQRDGSLNLNVSIRSNDLIWGFSGINFFEWSLLLQLMAESLGYDVGTIHWFTGAFQIYERHFKMAHEINSLGHIRSIYEFGVLPTPIKVQVQNLDAELDKFFLAEACSRVGNYREAKTRESNIADRFLRNSAIMMRIFNAYKRSESKQKVIQFLYEVEEVDFFISAAEFLARRIDFDPRNAIFSSCSEEFFRYYSSLK